MDPDSKPSDLEGLIPFEIHLDQRLVLWVDLMQTALTDPFFRDTLQRHSIEHRRPRIVPAPLSSLDGPARAHRPTTMIFHMSRCGSTLLTQLLAAAAATRVISEAQPLNAVLVEAAHSQLDETRIRWLRGLVHFLGQPSRYYVKCASWQVLQLPLIRRAFPGLRWVFLYRDPVEVLVSHERHPGWLPSAAPRARILADYCRAALDQADDNTLLVNYDQLVPEHLPTILDFLQVPSRARPQLAEVSRYHAKDPTRRRLWIDDRADKQREASQEIRQAADRWLAGPYAELEARRSV